MKVIKDKVGLSTDAGQSWKGLFYLIAPVIFTMPDGYEKTGLIVLWFLCMAWVSWCTVGNVHPTVADEINEDFSDDTTLADVIRRGRGRE